MQKTALLLGLVLSAGAAARGPELVPRALPAALAAPSPSSKNLWLSLGPGSVVFFQGWAGPAVSLRGAFELLRLLDPLSVQVSVPVSWLYLSVAVPFLGSALHVWSLAVLPSLGVRLHLTERLRLSLDLGAGFAHYQTSYPQIFVGNVTVSSTVAELGVSVGADFQLTERLSVFLEPLAFRGDLAGAASAGGGTSSLAYWSCLLGVALRVPQPGEAR